VSLANIYLELHRRAWETGQDRAQTLGKGARIAVRVQDGITTLTISRSKKPLGATEIETFKRDCGVPWDAVRFPQEGQGTIEREGMPWRYIAWRWREETAE